MSDRSHEEQRKQLEYLMSKNPEINLSHEQVNTDKVQSSDKAQKKSFDYSNYLRNKRNQLQVTKDEKEKSQAKEERDRLITKKERKQQELEAKTAKKRAERKKRLQHRKSKNEPKEISSIELGSTTTPGGDKKENGIMGLKNDEELQDLGIS